MMRGENGARRLAKRTAAVPVNMPEKQAILNNP